MTEQQLIETAKTLRDRKWNWQHVADHLRVDVAWLRAQPGIFPLAHGVSARVSKLRAAGNAITPQIAAEFIKATM